VKILKPNLKNAGSKVPYFCFVVFEEAASAEAALVEKVPVLFQTLFIEFKGYNF
jgi:hypothetical protein